MSFKKVLISSLCLSLVTSIYIQAQTVDRPFGFYDDVLLAGRTYHGGTARMQAIGGAQVSLGGDINAAYANPAGLGSIRNSAIVITPSFDVNNTETTFFGEAQDDSNVNLNFANLGVVFGFAKDEDSKFKGGAFAITMTRKSNFHMDYVYEGESGSSIVDSWLENANNNGNPIPVDDLPNYEFYAREHNLILDFYDANSGRLHDYSTFIGYSPIQYERVIQEGAQYEWDFAAGGNYNDIFYFGAKIGISSLNYSFKSTYDEFGFLYENPNNGNIETDEVIDLVSTQSTLDIEGIGFNTSIGFIVRPVDFFRIGFSAVSPTIYSMSDESTNDLLTQYGVNSINVDGNTIQLADEYYTQPWTTVSNYTLVTPWKLSAGASIFLGKYGFISADVDYIDYSQSGLRSNEFGIDEDDDMIQRIYTNTLNYRVGAEFRIDKLMLRGGYGYDADPFLDQTFDRSIQTISGGLGYRKKNKFIDLSVVHTSGNVLRTPYFPGASQENLSAQVTHKNVNVSVTLGVNF